MHALECLGDDGEPSGELWLKLKSGAALAATFGTPGSEPALRLQTLQQHLVGTVELPVLSARTQQDGPSWLCAPLETGVKAWQLPVLDTPLDVPERFAGHCYIKLVTKYHVAYRNLSAVREKKNNE